MNSRKQVNLNLLATNNQLWSFALSLHIHLWTSSHPFHFTIAIAISLLLWHTKFQLQ